MTDPLVWQGKIEDDLEHLVMPESKEVLRKQNDGGM